MTGSYKRECLSGLFGGHAVKKTAHGGLARVGAFSDPVDGEADHGSAHHGQVESGSAVADAAAIFSSDHIQSQVQARFDAPMPAVGLQHLLGWKRRAGTGTKEILGFDFGGGTFLTVDAAGQSGRLLDKRENDRLGGGVERDEAAGLGAAAIDFAGLDGGGLSFRGKKRATNLRRVVARFPTRPSDCL